jgi:excisionase family DNA binding protein
MVDEETDQVYLTGKEVSKILGVSRDTLYRLRKSGALDTYRKGGRNVLYNAADVKELLTKRNTITKQPTN